MDIEQQLHELAERYGIIPDYYDIWGDHHRISAQTTRALLKAMDAIGDEDEAQTARGRWQTDNQMLAPVQVVRVDEALAVDISVEIIVANALWDHAFKWRIEKEADGVAEGIFYPADLECLEDRSGRYRFLLPCDLDIGYHKLIIDLPSGLGRAQMRLIVAPKRCYLPPVLASGEKIWGIAVQLYALRSTRNWGIGDFTDLKAVIDIFAQAGASTVGLNPLHALYWHKPDHASPYSPSSRLFLNPLYLDVEAIADFASCDKAQSTVQDSLFQNALARLRQTDFIEYEAVMELKHTILWQLYHHFRQQHITTGSPRAQCFERYQKRRGKALRQYAVFCALHESYKTQSGCPRDWPLWDETHRDASAAVCGDFADAEQVLIGFYQYLQWQAELQLEVAAGSAAKNGMTLGLYRDLAVGVDDNGADVWSQPRLFGKGVHIGAPADDFSPNGQDWGLPPMVSHQLRAAAYQPFIEVLRANMQYAGAMRIDHVMSLARLFWVPAGAQASGGAYIAYPFEDLLRIVALESQRNQCLIIGEDLGTVPDEVRAMLDEYGVYSYRVLYFEKHWHGDGSFKAPADYPQQALVCAGTHDLPTLVGFWRQVDLQLRQRYGLFPNQQFCDNQYWLRGEDKQRLLDALKNQHLIDSQVSVDDIDPDSADFRNAVQAFLARTPAQLLMVQIEDVLGQEQPVNLPGTAAEYPNWRRKLSLNLEDWQTASGFTELAACLGEQR